MPSLLSKKEIAQLKEQARVGSLLAKIYVDLAAAVDNLHRLLEEVLARVSDSGASDLVLEAIPASQIDGQSVSFRCTYPYRPRSLKVWVDTLLEHPGTGYVEESDPGSGVFITTSQSAPAAGTIIVIEYRRA